MRFPRLQPVVLALAFLAGQACTGGAAQRPSPTSAAVLGHRVIVELAGQWAPEADLAPAALAEQRARIEAAQDEVVAALGDQGRLDRRLTPTAQMVVSVDDQGLLRLSRHPLVERFEPDEAGPAAATSGAAPPVADALADARGGAPSSGAPATSPGAPSTGPATTAPATPTSSPVAGSPPSTVASSGTGAERQRVIVTLEVGWAPEGQLAPAEREAQRQRVENAQDEVLAALGGEGSLSRRLTSTAQMSLSVTGAGLVILGNHPLVASTAPDATGAATPG
jgi:hypothetical protein